MSFKIRANLGRAISSQGKRTSIPAIKSQIGKVFGIMLTENTPTKELWENNGGWAGIGTIFYLEYNTDAKFKNNIDLTTCKIARPAFINQQYPLVGELVYLTDAPTPVSQVKSTSGNQKYYTGIVNMWNNPQQNSPTGVEENKTFIEKSDIRNLVPFEGDIIYQGRKGNGMRFGSTVKVYSDINEWSSAGDDGDPITILVNGYVTTDQSSQINVEEVNKELSSIYMTSTQVIPLSPDRKDTLNSLTKPLLPNKYQSSQLIFNSDRITLNSKKDEVMIFAKTNIEINTKNIINLNADGWVHINAPKIILGPTQQLVEGGTIYQYSDQPMLLGGLTQEVLIDLLLELSKLAASLTSAISAPPGAPLVDINAAGVSLSEKLNEIIPKIKDITSKINYLS